MSVTLRGTTELVVVTCWCGVVHAIPDSLNRIAEENHQRAVFCPLGHEWVVRGKTEAQKLREQLTAERERSGRIAAQRDQSEASLRATKGVVTKLKKRASAGVCPCCNRSFENLHRHMTSKHPEFSAPERDAVSPQSAVVS